MSVLDAARALAEGAPVLVSDGGGDGEPDFVFAGELAGPKTVAFAVRHGSGFVCAAMTHSELQRLDIPPMVGMDRASRQDVRVSVDAINGTTTGISAQDRAKTIRCLSDPAGVAGDFTRPGHVVPMAGHPAGLLGKRGSIEAAVDLTRIADLRPVAGVCRAVDEAGNSMRRDVVELFAREHGLAVVSVSEILEHRLATEDLVIEDSPMAEIESEGGRLWSQTFRDSIGGAEIAVLRGGPLDGRPLVHVHAECLVGDLFGHAGCRCRTSLDSAMDRIRTAGGVLVYCRTPNRSATAHLYRAAACGREPVEVNWPAVQVLRHIGVGSIRLLTDVAGEVDAWRRAGLDVEQEDLCAVPG